MLLNDLKLGKFSDAKSHKNIHPVVRHISFKFIFPVSLHHTIAAEAWEVTLTW